MKHDAPKKKMGRPRKYTPELARAICEAVAEAFPMHVICSRPGMPHESIVYRWINPNSDTFVADFRLAYADARQRAAARLAAEAIAIADDPTGDVVVKINRKTGIPYETTHFEHIQRSRLRVDTRRWMAAVLDPQRFGERAALELTGANGGPIRQETTIVADVSARLAALRLKLAGEQESA